MALVVATDSYLSVADADTYWANRNNSTWSGATTAQKEKALREATQYIDGAYNFIGALASYTQALAWPRTGATITSGNFKGAYFTETEIPTQIKNACAELALEALSARLAPAEKRGGQVKRIKVDVIETEYADFAPSGKTYDFVLMLLKDLTVGSKNQLKLQRV